MPHLRRQSEGFLQSVIRNGIIAGTSIPPLWVTTGVFFFRAEAEAGLTRHSEGRKEKPVRIFLCNGGSRSVR